MKQSQPWSDPEFRKAYHRKRYSDRRSAVLSVQKERRDERKAWLEERLSNVACGRCGTPRMGINWHYVSRKHDHPDSNRNLREVRHMAQNGYAQETIEAALQKLIPLCDKCQEETRPEYMEVLHRLPRQEYERAYRQKNKDKIAEHRRARVQARKDWLYAKLDQPCSECGTTRGVEWHYLNHAHDLKTTEQNLTTLRRMIHGTAAWPELEREFANLYPICKSCHAARFVLDT